MSSAASLRIGVSACLLGEAVRYDGGHKRDRFVTDVLGPFVEWVPVCPELEAGLGVPRPAMRLSADGDAVRVVEIGSGRDHTRALRRFSASRVRALAELGLSGYVLKKDSPSCGMARVRVYGESGPPVRTGRGVFAAALMEALPELPVEEEGRLQDPALRENFIERVFAYRRLSELFEGRVSIARLVDFHTAHKLQLMAHSQEAYRALGRLVAGAKGIPRAELRARYAPAFMTALSRIATRGRNANVLQHAAGHLKRLLASAARAELALLIDDYRRGLVPLVVPITLLRHHTRSLSVAYLEGQTFLEPHPKELMLRNHV
jgi:uncharacterized protein YbgA (DUF1722 family)/uncharacterized protein YbbK (DUF523 family)